MAEDVLGKPDESTAEPTEQVEKPVEATEPEQEREAEEPKAEEGGQPDGDIRSVVEELRSTITDLQFKVKQAEHNADYYRTLISGQDKPPEKQADSDAPVSSDDFWKDPLGVLRKELDTRDKRKREEEEKRTRTEMARKYETSFKSGYSSAVANNPQLYRGIEPEVADYVQKTAMQSGFTPDQLENPDLWRMAAIVLRASKGQPVDQFLKSSPKPVSSVSTERPGPTTPPKQKAQLSDNEKLLLQQWGDVTPEQYIETKKKLAEGG